MGTGPTTFGKNISIEGNKASTNTGTTTRSKNVLILDRPAVGNTTGGAPQTATAARANSKRNIAEAGQNGGERSNKKKKQQQLQEAQDEGQPMNRGGESRKKQKQQRQLESNQPPE